MSTMNNVLLIGGPNDNIVKRIPDQVRTMNSMITGTNFKLVYKRDTTDTGKMVYQGKFERSEHERKYP